MNRTLIAFLPPTALAAGLFLAHCSSSTPVVVEPDSGADTGSGTGTGHSSTTSKSTTTTTTTTSTTTTTTGTTTTSTTTTTTGTSTGTGTGAGGGDGGTGDTDATCDPPEGGSTCTPGFVPCGDAGPCAVPANLCCQSSTSAQCVTAGTACNAQAIGCEEKGDCTGGKICCLNATGASPPTATLSCQTPDGTGACPAGAGLAAGQLCRSNNECTNGSCSFWSCSATTPPTILETCEVPTGLLGGTCSKM